MNSTATMSPPTAIVAMETQSMTSDLSAKSFQHATMGNYTPLKAAPTNATGCTWLVALTAVAASLSGLMLGYELGLTSSVLLQLRGVLSLSCWEQEVLVGSLLLGCLVGCLAGGWGLDRYGRRWAMLLSGGLVSGGTALVLLPASLTTLSLGRAVVGMGAALSGTAACLYIAEIAPRERRGLLVTLYELMVVVGVLLGFGCSYAFSAFPDGWRYTFGLVLLPAILQAAALLLLPPSPRFLVAKGDSERARAVLALLRGMAGGEAVEEELRDIQAGLKEEAEHGFWELFSDKANLRWRLLTGVALVFLQQATGQPNVLSYASPLLRSMGFHSDAAATLASTGFGVVKVAGTVPAVLLVDRFGPKRFLCIGAVAMAMSLVTLGAVTFQSHTHLTSLCQSPVDLNHTHQGRDLNPNSTHSGLDNGSFKITTHFVDQRNASDLNTTTSRLDSDYFKLTTPFSSENQWNASDSVEAMTTNRENAGRASRVRSQDYVNVPPALKWISLVSLLVYVAAFSFSLGPMVYVVLSEIFPTGVRGKAVSVVSAVNWATNLLISMTFLSITERIGVPNIMFLYATMSFVLLVFLIFFIPETQGCTLEQISKELAKKKQLKVRFWHRVRPQETLFTIHGTPDRSTLTPGPLSGLN
ncbi:solute carrier family 2, facilitated glucose transporter member 12 [Esox lucius]|uniref:Solute carrier family 2, facilitated glucose transporter member 12 n=1 Tax=Esox lucius TaxID=8010 RepID=A0A3P8ZM26_ESOLU|nr:solute carrier family 2, facilitated glucose transporter member 12 [Esox lucius]XP_010881387.1 solute carrier family 2, facilitated glucose transporter member 12 [Esox lucius]